ncbi:hypothetical protein FFLO_05774 [Filobasidium floriforme]|uniref:Peroxin/Ferlin domain-containing protein n=1 Tax=Filobasidium floriforme TaxID=5210 RepID=A0A8K0JGA4_9TREE|nr:hypothetical protein FFLO_05774 [Filobasidium floriforme]
MVPDSRPVTSPLSRGIMPEEADPDELHLDMEKRSGSTDEVLSSIPTPIVRLLVILAKPIYILRKAIEILSWRSTSTVDSWLAIGCWWALCFAGRATWKLFLPVVIALPFLPPSYHPAILLSGVRSESTSSHSADKPASSATIIVTLSHLHAINAMLPSAVLTADQRAWFRSWQSIEPRRLLRGGIITWMIWVVLNMILGGRATLALVGSAILLASSPAIRAMYGLLSQSLFLRRSAALVFLVVFGSPPATPLPTPPPHVEIDNEVSVRSVSNWIQGKWRSSRRPSLAFRLHAIDESALDDRSTSGGESIPEVQADDLQSPARPTSEPLYFRFELQENQRWWMGLDWTSALLPQERPSWCDAYLNPSTPPSGFGLPSDSTMYLPEPRKGDPGGRTKRVSRWRWLDEDWSVVKRVGNGQSVQPVSIPPASGQHAGSSTHARSASLSLSEAGPAASGTTPDEPRKGIAEQAFVKGLERLKARTMAGSNATTGGSPAKRPISGDYGDHGSIQERSYPNAGRSSFEAQRRKSSAASDLAEALNVNASAHATASTAPRILGGGSANNASGSLSLLTDLDIATDIEGWCYGDNKWENMGPRGGMGRYTRRRRWQRRAVCTEEVTYIPGQAETASSASDAVKQGSPSSDVLSKNKTTSIGYTLELPSGAASPATVPATVMTGTAKSEQPEAGLRRDSHSSERDHVLRQRLKNVMANVGS